MRFRVLGSVAVVDSGGGAVQIGSRIQRSLLAVLLCRANEPVGAADLIEAVRGESPPRQAAEGLRVHIHHLRRVVGGERLTHRADGYRLGVEPGELDVADFDRLAVVARAAAATGDLSGARAALRDALALFRGPAYAGVSDEVPLLRTEAAAIDEKRLSAYEECFEVELALGLHAEICGELKNLAYQHPYRERLKGQLMLALYRSDRQADALQVYELTRRRLADELGVDPTRQLRDLHEQILRNDPALARPRPVAPPPGTQKVSSPSQAAAKPPSQLPAAPPDFTGRHAYLDKLDRIVRTGKAAGTVVITAIAGMAGVGKTALATHWAHSVRDRFPDGQLYINLRGFAQTPPLRSIDAMTLFLRALDLPADQIPTDRDEAIGLYRTTLSGRRLLLLIDNARSADQVRPLLPTDPGCLAVVTSRDRLSGLVAHEGVTRITLDVLDPEESEALLRSMLGDRVDHEPEAAAGLAEACGYLPLALRIAAANHSDGRYPTLAACVEALRSDRALDELDVDNDVQSSMRAAFRSSYRSLDRDAQRFFRLLGLHPGPDIGVPAAASLSGIALADAQSLVARLLRASLVTISAGRVAMHDLLRSHAADMARDVEAPADRNAALCRLLDYFLHTAHSGALLIQPHRRPVEIAAAAARALREDLADQQEALAWFSAEHLNLVAAVHAASVNALDRHAAQLAWTLTGFLQRQGHWRDWLITQQAAVEAVRRLGDEPGLANALRFLGLAHARLKDYDEALAYLDDARALFARLGDQTGLADCHVNLSVVNEELGRYSDSLDHSRQALERYRAAGHHVGRARALDLVGWYQAHLGEYHEAVEMCQQAVTEMRSLGDRYGEAGALVSLGFCHLGLGYPKQAVICYERAVNLYQDLADRFHLGDALAHLGDAYTAAAEFDSARVAWQRALEILDELGQNSERLRAKLASPNGAT